MSKINTKHLQEVKSFLQDTSKPILYETYRKGTNEQIELFFNVKDSKENNHGRLVDIYLDKIVFLPSRVGDKPTLYTPTYTTQILQKTEHLTDHLIVFGPKTIDSGIKRALANYVSESSEDEINDPLILLKVDFEKITKLAKEFPNIQYFCIKDVNDDRLQDVIIKGDMLEKTPQYREFVTDEDTKGSVNFLGITIDGRLFYIGRDGSIYSRNNFARSDVTDVIYSLLCRILSCGALTKTLDEF